MGVAERNSGGLAAALVLVALLLAVQARAATSTTVDGMTFDIPDGWSRKDVRDGILLQRSFEPAPEGGRGKPGMALIEVHRPVPASTGAFADAFARFADSLQDLAKERPMLRGSGVTVNSHPIVYQHRCCGSRPGVSIGGDYVGIAAPSSYHLLRLVKLNLRGDASEQADAEFGALVRSLRPRAADRAFALEPSRDAGGLDGAFTSLDVGIRPNVFGGLDMYSDNTIMVFDRSGLYSRSMPRGSMDVAGHCRAEPTDCGLYALSGGGLFGGASRIELTEVATQYAVLRPSTEPFARNGADLRIGGRDYRRLDPLPSGTVFDGTWRYTYASSGTMAFSSGGVSGQRTLGLTRDATSNEAGGTRTGFAGSSERPIEQGRYRVEGFHLVLTDDDGRSETLSVFEPERGSDGLLVIDGSNYLKQDQEPPPRRPSGGASHQAR